tara:strand:- start:853 stop:1284 length:432 start_codon:yes stop_codon:yes gene_type:complete
MSSLCDPSLPRRAAGVAIIFENSVLLAKRIEEYEGRPVPYGGYWSVFGGMVDEGESPFQAAARELWEEAEIKVPSSELKFIKRFPSLSCEFIFYVYKSSTLFTPKLNFEHSEYGWFSLETLDNFPEKIDHKIVECIQLYNQTI